MIWDARRLDNATYHRRRLRFTTVVGLLAIGMLALNVSSAFGDELTVGRAAGIVLYAGIAIQMLWMAKAEARNLKAASMQEVRGN